MVRILIAVAALAFATVSAAAQPIRVVAAQNFYGELAIAVGGDRVAVESILGAVGADPHDFEPPPSAARTIAGADIVIVNGADYDPWMRDLLAATPSTERTVIDVAVLTGFEPGDNPHVWYDPATMPRVADALADALTAIDPAGAAHYRQGRDAFLATLTPIVDKVAALREAYAGVPVAATEPVFGPMAEAIGLVMINRGFQTAIMNGIEPAASDVAAMTSDLRNGRAMVLFVNAQVRDSFTNYLVDLARHGGIPIVGVTETQPAGKTFAEWMLDQLEATAQALGARSS
jgi:zinc/manganese transport system substrate-binding protein